MNNDHYTSLDAIIISLATATLAVTVLGIIIAVVAVIGANSIKKSSKRAAERAALSAVERLIETNDIKNIIEDIVHEHAVKAGIEVYDDLVITSPESIATNFKRDGEND